MTVLSSVVLPMPFLPSRAKISPGRMSRRHVAHDHRLAVAADHAFELEGGSRPHRRCTRRVDRAHHLRVHHLRHRAVEHDAALVQDDDARADLAHEVEVVLDEQDAEPVAAGQVPQDLADQGALRLGEPGGRLVEQQHLGSSASTIASSSACFWPWLRKRASSCRVRSPVVCSTARAAGGSASVFGARPRDGRSCLVRAMRRQSATVRFRTWWPSGICARPRAPRCVRRQARRSTAR